MAQKKKDNSALLFVLLVGGGLMFASAKPKIKKTGKLKSKFYDEADLRHSDIAKSKGINQQFTQPLSDEIYANANYFVSKVLDPISSKIGKVKADSWWRSSELNSFVGGVSDSHHLKALATDLKYEKAGVLDNELLVKAILLMDIPFHKLIISGGLKDPSIVHISLKHSNNAKQIYLKDSQGNYAPVTKKSVLDALMN